MPRRCACARPSAVMALGHRALVGAGMVAV
eukprot:COSAG02_NODE_26147_length_639_cov_2.535185_2_plen_29_part_01